MLAWTGQISLANSQVAPSWDKLIVWENGINLPDSEIPLLTNEERKMLAQMKNLPKSNAGHVIYQVEGKYFGYNSCSLEVFEWNGSHWEFFSGSEISGATCSSYLFFWNERLFSLGGIGYWQTHSDLFEFKKGEKVAFTSVYNQPNSFVGILNFKTEKGLYSIFGNVTDFRKKKHQTVWNGYFLDLESKVWNSVEFDLNENFKAQFGAETFQQNLAIGGVFETKDFAIIEIGTPILKTGWLIIDKNTSELYVKEFNQSFLDGSVLKWGKINENTITVFPDFYLSPVEFDVDELVATAIPVGKLRIVDLKPEFEDSQFNFEEIDLLLFLLNLCVLVAIGGTIYFQRKQVVPVLEQKENTSENVIGWAKKLEEFQGLVVSQETIDELLGIQAQRNPDIRKTNRSRAIKSINEAMQSKLGETLITRVRDKEDKRVIHYQIGRFSSVKQPNERRKNPASV